MANFNLNKVILGGRLTANPELKTTPSGVSVTTFRIAVDRRFGKGEEKQTDFIDISAWRTTAEFVCKYFVKGSSICVVGSLQTRSYEKDGQKRTVYEIVADECMFVDGKNDNPAVGSPTSAPASISAPAKDLTPPVPKYVPNAYAETAETAEQQGIPSDGAVGIDEEPEELPF